MADKIEVGSVVSLKSGGPEMTVTGFKEPNADADKMVVYCTWFEKGKLEKGDFPLKGLELSSGRTFGMI